MAYDLHVGFFGETEDCVVDFPYATVDQPSIRPMPDLPECFFHPDSSCCDVLLCVKGRIHRWRYGYSEACPLE